MLERQLRLCSGLVLIAYILPHLFNVALGLWSLESTEWFRVAFSGLWHGPVMTLVLYSALLLHVGLGLYALWKRTTLKMPLWEALQLMLGLLLVPLLIIHLVDTRLGAEWLSITPSFKRLVGEAWHSPGQRAYLTLLVLVAWFHLAVGIYYWIRITPYHRRWLPYWYSLLLVLPLLAILGFVHIGRDLEHSGLHIADDARPSGSASSELANSIGPTLQILYLSGLSLVFILRLARHHYRRRSGPIRIHHPRHGTVTAQEGQTLLEALRQAGVSHSAICGGRGRCTTCQVLVTEGLDTIAPPGALERKALSGVNAPKAVRLACQLRLKGDIGIVPLLPPELDPGRDKAPGGMFGVERNVAIVFVDLRESSRLGATRLPYDVVFILNQFFSEMTTALEETGGHYAQFNGDGLMALYGLESGIESGCRDAVKGAQRMVTRLNALNRKLDQQLIAPLRMGIGVHSGEAIVGRMGPPQAPIVSAIGDNVNIAARLEQQTKSMGCSMVISRGTAERAGISTGDFGFHSLELAGCGTSLDVYSVADPVAIRFEDAVNFEDTIREG